MATIIEMPKLSDTMSVGTLVKWHKKAGDSVQNGDILAEVETDKATMELENFDDGTLLQIFVGEGEEVPIGSPLAAVGEPGEEVAVPELPAPATIENKVIPEEKTESIKNVESVSELDEIQTETVELKDPAPVSGEFNSGRLLISPLAKKMASESGININEIKGSGPSGRIVKKDILSHSDKTPLANPVENIEKSSPIEGKTIQGKLDSNLKDNVVPVSKMRSIIATRLLESKNTIPHFYLQKEINSTPLTEARAALNAKLASRNQDNTTKLTLNDIILKACAETISLVPEINSSWGGKEIILHGGIHLAFGVAVEDGLLTPVVRNANQLGLEQLSLEAKSLIVKARSKKLSPDEMSGSTFTVTNLGMFGIDFFSGIINPPNAAILSVGAIVKKPVVGISGALQAGETMMLGLSCDHRLVDGAVGAQFLKLLGQTLENPASMLV
jgi:pyruvate dehydrogenase E2 component (dihydrolipoamide acetyltransferase)